MSSDPPQRDLSGSPANDSSSPTESTNQSQENSAEVLTTSIDSSTLLLGPATATKEETVKESPTRPKPTRKNTEFKQCWICYADETEDTTNTSRWRSPCPCTLVAHESCLLDWVADLESPASRRTEAPKIQCPQCKKDIMVARPKSYVVQLAKATERLASRLAVPGIVLILGGGVYAGATMHGISSMYLIFGREKFEMMLGGAHLPLTWLVVLPFIPVGLILSRTNLADRILPTLPILLYATRLPQTLIGMDMAPLWPPSMELAFSSLPFIRSVYKQLWRALFAKKEAQWMRIVQPRAGATGDGAAAEPEAAPAENNAMDIFNFEVAIVDDDDNEIEADLQPEVAEVAEIAEIVEVVEAAEAEAGDAADVIPEQAPEDGAAAPAAAEANPGNQPRARQQQRGLTITGTHLADLVMGALAFPAIASAMGEILKLGLPASWIVPPVVFQVGGKPALASRPGFLQSKWARSLVGGCLFIVMKDSLLLYSKYRMAKDHQKRRICNWDKARDRYVDDVASGR